MQHLDAMLKENRIFKPSDAFSQQANIGNLRDYQTLWEFADKDYLQYWADLARDLITCVNDLQKLNHKDLSKVIHFYC